MNSVELLWTALQQKRIFQYWEDSYREVANHLLSVHMMDYIPRSGKQPVLSIAIVKYHLNTFVETWNEYEKGSGFEW